ncbi:CoA ester lyase [Nocardia sp. NBC_01377]|uniref:HpcH/HpaI aldolase/citrate lyase family protein n=1 Tax=Nocardia sp. NBC_01377 TaxID=2903595 RepID=UPI003245E30D
MQTTTGIARSLLFVPGNRPERFAKAVDSGADAIIIDLEDAVPPAEKSIALGNAISWLAEGASAVVRINGIGTQWHAQEIAALRDTDAVLMLPKAESLAGLADLVAALGEDRLIPLIETAAGITDADRICRVPGTIRIAIGNVDLAAELGVDPMSQTALAYARGRVVLASAAAGILPPIDGVTTVLEPFDQLLTDVAASREFGFTGKLCIHPRQVEYVNASLTPTETEIAWATRIARVVHEGVVVIDNQMVDPPVLARAERILRQADRATLS